VLGLVGGEIFARFGLGLGDPPLYVPDPQIEYLVKPGTYHRFGHDIHVNPWSMRSPDFPQHKADSNELRVLVVGDSLVFGGALWADSQVATSVLAARLRARTGRPAVVGNISAGSWGPPNELAYLERFGTFDADAIIVVWNSDDASDVPTFEPLGGDHPAAKPFSALGELFSRYIIPRYLTPRPPPAAPATQRQFDESLSAARALIRLAKSRNIPIGVVLHKTVPEIRGEPERGYEMLRAVAESAGAPVYESSSVLAGPLKEGRGVFSDDMHPNAAGQALLAGLYDRIVGDLLSPPVNRGADPEPR
jgi:hypothetical protein